MIDDYFGKLTSNIRDTHDHSDITQVSETVKVFIAVNHFYKLITESEEEKFKLDFLQTETVERLLTAKSGDITLQEQLRFALHFTDSIPKLSTVIENRIKREFLENGDNAMIEEVLQAILFLNKAQIGKYQTHIDLIVLLFKLCSQREAEILSQGDVLQMIELCTATYGLKLKKSMIYKIMQSLIAAKETGIDVDVFI